MEVSGQIQVSADLHPTSIAKKARWAPEPV